MKTGFVKLITLMGYLGMILIFTGLQWESFLSVRILLLVMAGTFFLSIPELLKERRKFFTSKPSGIFLLSGILEKQSISAGLLLSFLLFFSDGSMAEGYSGGIYQAALCFRPLFYGYCIYILLHSEETPVSGLIQKESTAKSDVYIPAEDEYSRLRELGLTNREAEIAGYLLHGQSNYEIAEALTISEATVKKHISNIFQKLNIGRREQLAGLLLKKDD